VSQQGDEKRTERARRGAARARRDPRSPRNGLKYSSRHRTGPDDAPCRCVVGAQFDGTTTAIALYVNAGVTDAISANAVTVAIAGTLTVTWINLGDY
jgi:hypothetical protein